MVDGRSEEARLDIFRHGPKGYTAARKKDGWMKSHVFGKSFRLLMRQSRTKHPDYELEVR